MSFPVTFPIGIFLQEIFRSHIYTSTERDPQCGFHSDVACTGRCIGSHGEKASKMKSLVSPRFIVLARRFSFWMAVKRNIAPYDSCITSCHD